MKRVSRWVAAAAVAMAAALGVTQSAKAQNGVDIVFIVDESGSMGGEHAFIQQIALDLDSALVAAGVTNRSYSAVGFGGQTPGGTPITRLGTTAGNAGAAALAGGVFQNPSGGFEDGYEAMEYALANTGTAGYAKNYILITDEDRDIRAGSTTFYAGMLAQLQAAGVLLNTINDYRNSMTAGGIQALGQSADGDGYRADGLGGFVKDAPINTPIGFGTTVQDYYDLAFATGGAAWDLNLLRAGGLLAQSFAEAFIDIKVEEVVGQIIPLPGAAGLALAGMFGLGVIRRRR